MKKLALLCALIAVMSCFAFTGCSADINYLLKYDGDGNGYYSISCSGFTASLKDEYKIPAYYEGLPVKEVEAEGFAGTHIVKLIVPATIEKIGVAAFSYNRLLKSVEFEEGSNLKELSRGAFGYCSALKEVRLPDGLEKISEMAFESCTKLESVNMGTSLEIIADKAFEHCNSLDGVVFPETLKEIGAQAFYETAVSAIVIPDSVEKIGYSAFHTCTSLKTLTVGKGVSVITSGAFGYCTSLESVYLSSTLKSIEGAYFIDGKFECGHSFHSAEKLKDIYFDGTKEEWEELKSNINNEKYEYSSEVVFDNGSLLNATVHFN